MGCQKAHIWDNEQCALCKVEALKEEIREHMLSSAEEIREHTMSSEERIYLQSLFNRKERELTEELKSGVEVARAKKILRDLELLKSARTKLML